MTWTISHLPDAAERWIEAHANCEMLIYNVGGASIADRDNSQRIKALRAIAPDVPLLIFAESESREEIISALNVGAQGLLYAGMNSALALQAPLRQQSRRQWLVIYARSYWSRTIRGLDAGPPELAATMLAPYRDL